MEAGLELHPQATACKTCRQAIHQADLLKAGTLDVGSQPSIPEGEVATGEFPPGCMALCWEWDSS